MQVKRSLQVLFFVLFLVCTSSLSFAVETSSSLFFEALSKVEQQFYEYFFNKDEVDKKVAELDKKKAAVKSKFEIAKRSGEEVEAEKLRAKVIELVANKLSIRMGSINKGRHTVFNIRGILKNVLPEIESKSGFANKNDREELKVLINHGTDFNKSIASVVKSFGDMPEKTDDPELNGLLDSISAKVVIIHGELKNIKYQVDSSHNGLGYDNIAASVRSYVSGLDSLLLSLNSIERKLNDDSTLLSIANKMIITKLITYRIGGALDPGKIIKFNESLNEESMSNSKDIADITEDLVPSKKTNRKFIQGRLEQINLY